MRRSKLPSYLTKNRFGIYSSQARIHAYIIHSNQELKCLIRFTLKTSDRAIAVRLARRKALVLDSIKHHFDSDPKSAGRAIELWLEYEKVVSAPHDWNDVDLFLSNLDAGDRHLLHMVLGLNDSQDAQAILIAENHQLKQSLASLQSMQ